MSILASLYDNDDDEDIKRRLSEDIKHRLSIEKRKLKKHKLSDTALIHLAALMTVSSDNKDDSIQELNILFDQSQERVGKFSELVDKYSELVDEIYGHLISTNIELNGAKKEIAKVLADTEKLRIEAIDEGMKYQKLHQAKKAAIAKLANDPKQADKKLVRECWQNWQEKPDRYKSQAAFARDMLEKYDHLKSHKVIEDWCRKWKKPNPAS